MFLGVPPLILPAVITMLPKLRHLNREPDHDPSHRRHRKPAAFAAAGGAGLLQLAGTQQRWLSLVWFALGLGLLLPGLRILLPPGTLRGARGLPMTVLMRGVLAGAFFGAESFIPLMLVSERGVATTYAGLTLTGAALTWTLGSWFQGRPGLRVPRPRLVQIGIALVAVGIGGAALALWPALPPAVAALGWLVGGLGMGLGMTSVSVLTLQQSPPGDQGANSAAVQICDALGGIVFIGVAGSIFAALHTQAGDDTLAFLVIFGRWPTRRRGRVRRPQGAPPRRAIAGASDRRCRPPRRPPSRRLRTSGLDPSLAGSWPRRSATRPPQPAALRLEPALGRDQDL